MKKENQEDEHKEKPSIWSKINLLIPHLNKIIIALVVGYLGNKYTILQKEAQDKQSNMRLYSELISSRETSENNQRTVMFQSIIKDLVENINTENQYKYDFNIQNKILKLELLVSNFHDSIQLKPLFENILNSINKTKYINKSRKEYFITKLENVASNIRQKQQSILEKTGYKFDLDIDLNNKENKKITGYNNKVKLNNNQYDISIICINKDIINKKLELQITVVDNYKNNSKLDRILCISYFDFPMINNMYLSNNLRLAITLRNINNIFASITVLFFPESYSSLKEKTYYEDIIKNLIK